MKQDKKVKICEKACACRVVSMFDLKSSGYGSNPGLFKKFFLFHEIFLQLSSFSSSIGSIEKAKNNFSSQGARFFTYGLSSIPAE
jgi:hypothetical protein